VEKSAGFRVFGAILMSLTNLDRVPQGRLVLLKERYQRLEIVTV
jgi:hypothetical protein